MDSFYPVFFELLKVSGVKSPTEDLLFPFVITLMIGFIMGAIAAFTIKKIASLEKKNKKIIQRLESKMHLNEILPSTSTPTNEKKKDDEQITELSEKIVEKQPMEDPQANTAEPKSEQKKKKKSKKAAENEIKRDPDFKPPEVRERKEEEADWNVVRGKTSKKPK